ATPRRDSGTRIRPPPPYGRRRSNRSPVAWPSTIGSAQSGAKSVVSEATSASAPNTSWFSAGYSSVPRGHASLRPAGRSTSRPPVRARLQPNVELPRQIVGQLQRDLRTQANGRALALIATLVVLERALQVRRPHRLVDREPARLPRTSGRPFRQVGRQDDPLH